MPSFRLASGLAARRPRPRVNLLLRALAWALRRLAVLVAMMAVAQRHVLRSTHRLNWKLEGSCGSCGNCCENLLLPVDTKSPLVTALRRYWHEVVFDFFPRDFQLENEGKQFASYGCRNFTAERTCSKHRLRPFVCRAYPALALFDAPQPKPHCGYQLVQLGSPGKRD